MKVDVNKGEVVRGAGFFEIMETMNKAFLVASIGAERKDFFAIGGSWITSYWGNSDYVGLRWLVNLCREY